MGSTGEWRVDPTGRYTHRWWDGSKAGPATPAGNGTVTTDPIPVAPPSSPAPMNWPPLNPAPSTAPAGTVFPNAAAPLYTGPIPSPAKSWALWVIVTTAVAAIGNAVVVVLNLMERHNPATAVERAPAVARARAPDDPHNIHIVGRFDLVVASIFLVVTIIWANKRRPRARLRQFGETAVEPSLYKVIPAVYVALFVALGVALLFTSLASGEIHTPTTTPGVHHLPRRSRDQCGADDLVGVLDATCGATQLQGQREAEALAMRGR